MAESRRPKIAYSDKQTSPIKDENWHLRKTKELVSAKGIVIPLLEERLMHRAHDHQSDRDQTHIHPSEMSKSDWCPRSTWFRIKGYPVEQTEKFSFRLQNIYEEGHDIHNKWQTWAWDAGILEGMWRCLNAACKRGWWDISPHECPYCGESLIRYDEVPIYNELYRIIGHADGILVIDGVRYIWELKSLGVRTLEFEAPTLYKQYKDGSLTLDQLWQRIKRPLPSHRRQGGIYSALLLIPRVIFIYEWKPNQAYKEFPPVNGYSEESTPQLLADALTVVNGLDTGFPPTRPKWASSPENATCKKCPYVTTCWQGDDDDGPPQEDDSKPVAEATAGQRSRMVRRGTNRRGAGG